MDFEPCFKVYNLVYIRPKSMKLGQMTNLNVILQFETRPSSPLNFGMAYANTFMLPFQTELVRIVTNVRYRIFTSFDIAYS